MKADFDIGNLVYVILTIVFVAIGAMGKKKKPQTQVSHEEDVSEEPETLKTQFQEIFRELNPTTEVLRAQEYYFTSKDSVEDTTPIDVVPDLSTEKIEDIIPAETQPIDSNIDYRDQAQSSLDTTGMDEGEPAFDYSKDHSSLVYNSLTDQYSAALTDMEEEMSGLVEDFNPRTAFIYSEIFNRKDF